MKTKKNSFSKIITFCVLSLFLITNMILFTSCDNGNSPNDNTNEEQNNNAPTDYCKICDGVQDKDHQHDYCDDCEGIQDENHQHDYCDDCEGIQDETHQHDYCDDCEGIQDENHQHDYCDDCEGIQDETHQHDYCDDCEGIQDENHQHDYCNDCEGIQDETHQHDYCDTCDDIQTDPNHTCPIVEEPTLSAEVEHIGNGTYSIANFMVSSKDNLNEKISENLECAEKHIKGFAGCFENTANNQNLQNLVNVLGTESTYNTNNTTGFDPIINKLNNACAPIFEEIIENIDNDLDVAFFKNEYKGLSLKTYKDASGNYFDGNSAQETYNTKKDSLNKAWAMMHALNSIDQEFSIVEDIENNKCIKTTSHMDELLLKHDIANDLGISGDDLKNFINLSLTITSLDAMHDYATAKGYSKHVITYCDGLDNELTKL